SMTVAEARSYIEKTPEGMYTLLDVRQEAEYAREHIPGATLVPLSELADSFERLDEEMPVIVYCAMGGRSRVAAQLLAGRGFSQVYNLQGGIKAWNGHKAVGPREFHLNFITKDENPEQMILLAYHMESAVQEFYRELKDRTADEALAAAFADLAAYEEEHKQRVVAISGELGLLDEKNYIENGTMHSDIIEGGFEKDTFFSDNGPHLTTLAGVLDVAMMLETQSLDLYLRLADEVTRNTAREFLLGMAREEKQHLSQLAAMLEKTA
ncbi:rhodanese-like domain-containing protein, partial [Thermodesulfobacteriota bacterium]